MNEEKEIDPEVLRVLKTQYNKAKDLLDKITVLHSRFDSAQTALEASRIEVEKISTDARERFNTIDNAKNDSTASVAEIKSNLEKVQSSIATIEEGLLKFENIRGKIESKDGEIEALTSTANSLRADIEGAKATAQQRLQDIENLLVETQGKIKSMQEAYESFLIIHSKIIDEKDGLQAVLAQSKELQTKSKEVFAEINSFREESKKHLDAIQANKDASDDLKSQTEQVLSEVNADRAEVESITALITDTGFANAFRKREKFLRWSAGIWLIIFIAALFCLAYLVVHLFGSFETVPEIQVLLYRLTLTSPLLFLIGVSLKQYSNEREFNEKYAFKAVIAAVMRNHAKYLADFDTSENNVAFLRDAIAGIYEEPYSANKEELNHKKLALEKDQNKKAKAVDLIGYIKELKAIIPEPETFKSVIEVLLKFR